MAVLATPTTIMTSHCVSLRTTNHQFLADISDSLIAMRFRRVQLDRACPYLPLYVIYLHVLYDSDGDIKRFFGKCITSNFIIVLAVNPSHSTGDKGTQ